MFKQYNKTTLSIIEWAKNCVEEMQEILAHTDNLKNSITYELVNDDKGWIVFFKFPEYAIFVNDGRAAGKKQPPLDAIKKWAIQKNLPTFKTKAGKDISEDSRAFLIARSISQNGIKPIPFMDVPSKRTLELTEAVAVNFAIDLASEYQKRFDSISK